MEPGTTDIRHLSYASNANVVSNPQAVEVPYSEGVAATLPQTMTQEARAPLSMTQAGLDLESVSHYFGLNIIFAS